MNITNVADYTTQTYRKQYLNQRKKNAEVQKIILEVLEKKDKALIELTEKFDNIKIRNLKVSEILLDKALSDIEPTKIDAIELAAKNIKHFHAKNILTSWQEKAEDGTILGQTVLPINRIGIYVPGGLASYPSTVIMNAIPAKMAKVKEIVVVTPPLKNGLPNPDVLAACKIMQLDEVYAVGGAQAIAALALGTETIKPVDKIFGPGNIYVTEAKKQLFGIVGIDMPAGPSEVAIYCDDEETRLEHIAYDLMAQAEHDSMAKVFLISTNKKIIETVLEIINKLLPDQNRKDIIKQAIAESYFLLAKDKIEAATVINDIAPEHLEIFTKDKNFLNLIKNAGAIFIGKYASAVIGDYMAGPNHTLPTMRASRFLSPLSVNDFLKTSSLVNYSEIRFKKEAARMIRLAEAEGLSAHADAIRIRLDN